MRPPATDILKINKFNKFFLISHLSSRFASACPGATPSQQDSENQSYNLWLKKDDKVVTLESVAEESSVKMAKVSQSLLRYQKSSTHLLGQVNNVCDEDKLLIELWFSCGPLQNI